MTTAEGSLSFSTEEELENKPSPSDITEDHTSPASFRPQQSSAEPISTNTVNEGTQKEKDARDYYFLLTHEVVVKLLDHHCLPTTYWLVIPTTGHDVLPTQIINHPSTQL